MDLFAIGSLNAYTKNLKLQTQWNLKKESGDTAGKGKSLSDWLQASQGLKGNKAEQAAAAAAYADAIQRTREQGDDKLREIMNKVYAGGKLTRDEREYLRAKDPEAWQKLKSAEQEQKSYERELKRCKTKEEVQRLKMTRLNASLNTVKSVENNPHIPLEKKLEIAMQEKLKCDNIQESTQRFVEKGEYGRLPTQAEQAQAEQERQEAEEVKAPEAGDQQAQKPEEAETPGQEEPDRPERTETAPKREPDGRAESAAGPESPEARKVRRAKARAAYAAAEGPEPEPGPAVGHTDLTV